MDAKTRSELDLHVGHRLHLRRALLGLTQKELAKRIGVQFQQVQKYEKGINSLNAYRLWRLSRALAVDPSYFYAGLSAASPPPDEELAAFEAELLNPSSAALLRNYAQLSPREQACVSDLVSVLADKRGPGAGTHLAPAAS